jgi:hypothetical protein
MKHLITSKELDVLRSYVTGRWPAGMSSGTFGDIRERLRSRGLIEGRPGLRAQNRLTEAGSSLLAHFDQQQERQSNGTARS